MASLNKVSLIGNLGADPDSRFMPDGTQVVTVSIATTEGWKDKEGVKQEKTEWHRVIFYAGLADVVSKYLKKGSQIYVEGKLSTRKWEDKQQAEHYSTEIIGKQLIMLGKNVGKSAVPDTTNYDDAEPSL
ncbi:MAG: single-stranded DNA-binding protein [Nitrosospira sp.]